MKTEKKEKKTIQFITFKMNDRTYAINISHVREINKLSAITPVPRTDDFIDGVMNLRGSVIPVINIRKRLHLAIKSNDKKNKLIIVEYDTSPVGLIVDEISEVVKIEVGNIENDKIKMLEIGAEYIKSIGKTDDGILAILDIYALLERERRENASAV